MKKLLLLTCLITTAHADNQTSDLSTVSQLPLPFKITIELADFSLPTGLQTTATAQCGSHYLFITGRTNGMHTFNNDNDNFPPNQQNTTVFVVNPCTRTVTTRSLHDPYSGLTQKQIDSLSVTAAQYYQKGNTLYIAGGYGVDSSTGLFSTKDTLTAIDVPGLIQWVTRPQCGTIATQYIRQISHPLLQVTGGHMFQIGKNPTLLMFGQNFQGYYVPDSNGNYTEQVRRFCIIDKGTGKCLSIVPLSPTPPDPNYRRRDLNIVPLIKKGNRKTIAAFVALSGVFTVTDGAWTVPVEISANGCTHMADPHAATTFKQGMNNYICPTVELISKEGTQYIALFGGITYEYFQGGQFFTDAELPFTNNVTIIKRCKCGYYSQYLSPNEYPTILSTASNPGNVLLFGASGRFMPAGNISAYSNGVLKLWKIKKPTIIGYIIGGIQSTVPNTSVASDSAASPYIFKVILTPC